VKCYGYKGGNPWRIAEESDTEDLTQFRVIHNGFPKYDAVFETHLFGHHNLSNALSAVVLAQHLGLPHDAVMEALKTFKGVKRRQEVIGEKRGITVMDDFAHHPTAVKETISAVKKKYPDRRLVAVFEPRSNSSRRNIFQSRYAASFDQGDLIMIREPAMIQRIPPEMRFSARKLVSELKKRSLAADSFPDTDVLLKQLLLTLKKGDMVLIMSNGGFDNLHQRLLESL
jgi:UDP-N-acetylmuramate: L-alanyl-gamma-D-glutamyl-meso-diaminopimelate ligase